MADIWMSSRGAFEEKLRAITEALHQEIHLIESMQKEPDKVGQITPLLDRIRLGRQQMVKMTFGTDVNPNFWCNVKHSLTKIRHLEESLQNAARSSPYEIQKYNKLLQEAIIDRDESIGLFKNKVKGSGKGGSCARCVDDLRVFDERITGGGAQSLNTDADKVTYSKQGDDADMTTQKALMEYGYVQVAQFLGEGGVFAGDFLEQNLTPTNNSGLLRTRNIVNIGGGLALGLAGALMVKNETLKKLMVIAGSHMAAVGVV
ncbi:hypothetical protein HYS50_01595, partial [Candidatus Woesearchaeota archaeon]|nr:hypothetical protein [Candidatus Woesearchaeota archaeon]